MVLMSRSQVHRPPVINRALKLVYFSLAISLLNVFVGSAAQINDKEFQDTLSSLTQLVQMGAQDFYPYLIGVSLFFWASFVLLAWLLSRRSRGARVFYVISVLFALISSLYSLVKMDFSFSSLLSDAVTVLQTYACVLFYSKESTAWFESRI